MVVDFLYIKISNIKFMSMLLKGDVPKMFIPQMSSSFSNEIHVLKRMDHHKHPVSKANKNRQWLKL